MKTAKDYLEEANAVVRKIEMSEAMEKHESNSAIFIDNLLLFSFRLHLLLI